MAGSKKKHCEHCRENFLKHVEKTSKGSPNVFVNVREMIFPCQVPTFTTNRFGFSVAMVKNCKLGTWEEMPIEEWRRRNQRGEL